MEGRGKRLKDDPSFKALQNHYDSVGSKVHMRKLFEDDPKRFEKFRCVYVIIFNQLTDQQIDTLSASYITKFLYLTVS